MKMHQIHTSSFKMCALVMVVLLLLSILTACASPAQAPAEPSITLKLSYAYAEDHPAGQAAQMFVDKLQEYTNGRVKVEVYPRATLFQRTEEFNGLVTGAVDISFMLPYWFMASVPSQGIWYLKGAWAGIDHIKKVEEDGRLNKEFLAPDLEEKGVKWVGDYWADSGKLIYLIKGREIKRRDDMKGLRLGVRVGSPRLPHEEFVGLIPVSIDSAEMLSAMAQGMIDVLQTAVNSAVVEGWYHYADYGYIYPTHSASVFGGAYFNLNSWNKLPTDIQKLITDKIIPEVYEASIETVRNTDEEALATLKSELKAVHEEPMDYYLWLSDQVKDDPFLVKMRQSIDPRIIQLVTDLRPDK